MNISDVLTKPSITEKSSGLTAKRQYTMVVNNRATKDLVKKAVETLFKVEVTSVNTYNRKGKVKNFGRGKTKMPDTKRAIVTLVAGQSLNLYGET